MEEQVKREYEIGGGKYFVDELTLEQDKLIAGMIKELGTAFLADKEINVLGIINLLIEKDLLSRFMSLILIPVSKEFDKAHAESIMPLIDKMKSSAAVEAVEDFLLLNGGWAKKVISFFPALQIQTKKLKTASTSTIS